MKVLAASLFVALIVASAYASGARAQSSLYAWPNYFKQAVVASCTQRDNTLVCGCYVRHLRSRWTYGMALSLGQKLANGDELPRWAQRDIYWASYSCH